MVGARVNGNLVNIDYKIKNGRSNRYYYFSEFKGSSRDWLNLVKSTFKLKTKLISGLRSS